MFALLALFLLKAPRRIRKRLWVQPATLVVWPLLVLPLVGWAAGDLIGFPAGFCVGVGAGIGVSVVNIIRDWPRKQDPPSDGEERHDGT